MKIEIMNFATRAVDFGYICTFDVTLDGCVSIHGLCLRRRDKSPDSAWLVIPDLARPSRHACSFTPTVRAQIAERAAMMYEAATGVRLTYEPPPRHVAAAAQDEPQDEPEDAGLRRVLCASVEDGLRQVAG